MSNEEDNIIQRVYGNHEALVEFLKANNQLSFISDYNALFSKILILSCGSYFEVEITSILMEFADLKSNNDSRLSNFIKRQAISAKYHQLFDWGKKDKITEFGSNLNQFLKLFGQDFCEETQKRIASDDKLSQAIKAFLEIGHARNIIVHQNLANYSYEKSPEEVFKLFQNAISIIPFFRQLFLEE